MLLVMRKPTQQHRLRLVRNTSVPVLRFNFFIFSEFLGATASISTKNRTLDNSRVQDVDRLRAYENPL